MPSLSSNRKRKSTTSTVEPTRMHSCHKCDQVFRKHNGLSSHLRYCTGTNHIPHQIQHSQQWMSCFKCKRNFLTVKALNAHMSHCKSKTNSAQNTVTYTKSTMDAAVKNGDMGISNNAYMGQSYATQLQFQQSLQQMDDQVVHEQPDIVFETNFEPQDEDIEEEEEQIEQDTIPDSYIQKMKLYEDMKNKYPEVDEAPEPCKSGNSFSTNALARIELLKIVQNFGGGEAMFDSIETWATHWTFSWMTSC